MVNCRSKVSLIKILYFGIYSNMHILYLSRCTETVKALAVIAIGNGGIKPCVSSLGGDQFTGTYNSPKMITRLANSWNL